MRIRKIASVSVMLVVALLMLALAAVPASADGVNKVYFEPSDSRVPQYCETVDVDIYMDTVDAVTSGWMKFDYTYCCADVIVYTPNDDDWDINYGDVSIKGQVIIGFSTFEIDGLWGKVLIGTVTIHCCDIDSDCSTPLAWDETSYLMSNGTQLAVTWEDGTFTCGCVDGVVVSLGKLPGTGGVGSPPIPPGFEPRDEFVPCEWVYAWGYGFDFCQVYEIYVQPYVECTHVGEGDVLDHSLSADLGYPDPAGVPVIVHIEEDGTFGPVALFHVPEGLYCTYWEIVADKIGPDHEAGIYNACEDGLDAIACDEPGFHIVPEALTVILFGAGLVSLGGYVGLRRRKSTETDA